MAERGWSQKLSLVRWILLDALRRFFTENKLLKLISFAIALFMWITISTQEERDRTLENIQLKVVNRRTDTVVMNVPVKVVDIRVRGPLSIITDLDPEHLGVVVDATGLQPGTNTVWLTADQVNTPSTVEVLRIDPPNIPVTIAAKTSRQVPVRLNIKQESLPPGRIVLESEATPTTVQATGPFPKINDLKEVLTEPIDLRTAGVEETRNVGLITPDQLITLNPPTVSVNIRLDELGTKLFTDLKPMLPRGIRSRSTQTVTVALQGPQSLLDKIKPADILVKLATTRLTKGEHKVTPAVELAQSFRGSVRVTSVEPERLVVRAQ
ncbi:MAG: hypothetical protein HY314_15810 [Acidobacteria bacterium]|nr:hypothetical protein [Acidobacteriota bacterium]